jgi:hypothetical protein
VFGVQSERQSFWDQVDMNNGVIPSGILFTKAEDVLNLELKLRAAVKKMEPIDEGYLGSASEICGRSGSI